MYCKLQRHKVSLNLHSLSLSRYTTSLAPTPTIQPNNHQHHPKWLTEQPILSKFETQTKTLLSLIKSTTQKTHLLQIHTHLIRNFLFQNRKISLAFLSRVSLSPFNDTLYSSRIFWNTETRSVLHFNTMIRAHSISSCPIEGVLFYQELRRRGLCADPVTLSFVIKCFGRVCSLFGGQQVHARVLSDGHQMDCLLLTNLMNFYSVCELSNKACKVFDEMPKRDVVAWNVLISCLIRNRRSRDALGLFDGMVSGQFECECEPDDVTCLLLLQACANLGALEFGKKIHGYIQDHGYGDEVHLCNSLISMYSRCGFIEKAYSVFKGMCTKNVVTWSSMISGFSMNGFGRQALEAFGEMQRMGVLPDDQTLTGVLSACSHSGLVDEGMEVFEKMNSEFELVPNNHHYGCMVDLLGRAGQLDKAYQLILSMGVKPDVTIWRTLLGACRIHRHVTLGERVVGHLIELKAEEAGDYVLLLNIYSSIGNWEKVTELRKLMKDQRIQTTPGCSTIELKGKVHEFVADDLSHPRKDEIYEMLVEINSQLKIAGYVAEITSELHNMDTEEKRHVLSFHSEKLAIAFGILSTPPGTTIRVAKNLRICVDCHNFAKVVSGVYNREVIIRDRTRFHHFREGRCSCNDYW